MSANTPGFLGLNSLRTGMGGAFEREKEMSARAQAEGPMIKFNLDQLGKISIENAGKDLSPEWSYQLVLTRNSKRESWIANGLAYSFTPETMLFWVAKCGKTGWPNGRIGENQVNRGVQWVLLGKLRESPNCPLATELGYTILCLLEAIELWVVWSDLANLWPFFRSQDCWQKDRFSSWSPLTVADECIKLGSTRAGNLPARFLFAQVADMFCFWNYSKVGQLFFDNLVDTSC